MFKDNQMLALKILEPGMMRVEQVPHIVPMQNLNLQILTSGYHGWHDWHLNIFPRFKIEDPNYLDFSYNLNLF